VLYQAQFKSATLTAKCCIRRSSSRLHWQWSG